MNFSIFKTKIGGLTRKFNLSDPDERREYFAAKAGREIEKIREYLSSNTFVGYLLGKKNSGKGTYSKLFIEAVGSPNIGHVAVGDIVRDVHDGLSDAGRKKELTDFLSKNYRGFHTLEEIVDLIEGRSQEKLISSELILALLKYEISRRPRQAVFIDGFPRGLDQVNYAIFLKELLGYRDDPDFFVFIDVPETVIDERIKSRVVCPDCKTPRGLKLLTTKDAGWDPEKKEFYLICDNQTCEGKRTRMLPKEGDELGIEPIRKRLETDDRIFRQLLGLKGVPKVLLRNSVPVAKASEYVDEYELTPAYSYELDPQTHEVKTLESPWIVKDEDGVPSYSLLPPAVVVAFIKQAAQVLNL